MYTREMVLSEEDRILIKNLYYFKGYGAKRLISEFPAKGWKKTTVNDFLKRLKDIGSTTQTSIAEGQEQFKQWRISVQSMTSFSVGKMHLIHHTTQHIARETVHLLYE